MSSRIAPKKARFGILCLEVSKAEIETREHKEDQRDDAQHTTRGR